MLDDAEGFRGEVEKCACRFLWFGVAYADLRAAMAAGSWRGWSERLEEMAMRYDALADDAARHHPRTAADLWRRAAVYFHFAELKLGDGEAKRRLQERCRASYRKGSASLLPPARRIEVRSGGAAYPGYLRLARRGAPCVILINGLDSAKEVELDRFAEGFLERGLSVFCFDGPGQGEGQGGGTLDDLEPAVSAAIDALSAAPATDPERFGVFGVSYGGHLACRVAASERRLEACVSLGGFFDGSILRRLPPPAWENLARAYSVAGGPASEDLLERISLAPLAGAMDRPLLIVHGADDHLVDRGQVEALQRWAPASELRVYEPGEHVCTDRFAECLPMLWDWMAGRLVSGTVAPQAAGVARSLEVRS